jgi:hypothetical protein
VFYVTKPIGIPTDLIEKCTTGCLFSTILILMLVGPLFFFSEFGGLTQLNPVIRADLDLSFLVNKTIYTNETTGKLIPRTSF